MGRKIVRILEGRSLLYDDIVLYYRRGIMKEDYIVMHELDDDRIKVLSATKPFFSEYYVVEIHLSTVNSRIVNILRKFYDCSWVMLILICFNKDCYDALSTLDTVDFNGYKISEKYWTQYVMHRVKYNTNLNYHTVYNNLAGRFELTDIIIDEINKQRGKISVAMISKIIGKSERMSLDMFWFNIINQDERNRGKVFKFLEDYRYGFDFIYKNLLKQYESLIKYYKDFRNGLLNEMTLREYKKDTHGTWWKLKTYVDLFSTVSFDEILLIGEMIECANVKSTSDLFVLVGKLYLRGRLEEI